MLRAELFEVADWSKSFAAVSVGPINRRLHVVDVDALVNRVRRPVRDFNNERQDDRLRSEFLSEAVCERISVIATVVVRGIDCADVRRWDATGREADNRLTCQQSDNEREEKPNDVADVFKAHKDFMSSMVNFFSTSALSWFIAQTRSS